MNFAELQQALATNRERLEVLKSERAANREKTEEFRSRKRESFRIPELKRFLSDSEGCAAHCDDEKRDLQVEIDSKEVLLDEDESFCTELENELS